MIFKNYFLFAFLIIITVSLNLYPKSITTFDGEILTIAPTARTAALGTANSSLTDDINSLFANPAGLSNLTNKSIMFSHFDYVQDVNLEYLAFALSDVNIKLYNEKVNLGFDFTMLHTDDIDKNLIISQNGMAAEQNIGTYKNRENIIGLYYASAFENINFGLGVRYINSKLDNVTAQAVRVNVGLQKYIIASERSKFALSAEIKNIGNGLKYDKDYTTPPFIFRSGIGYIFGTGKNNIKTEIDIEYIKDNPMNYYFSSEIEFLKIVNLRLGYDSRNDAGDNISFGAGLNIISSNIGKIFCFDYAFIPFGDLGNTHRFSLTYNFGK